MADPIRIGVCGAGGRLGGAIVAAIEADPGLVCTALIGRDGPLTGAGAPLPLDEALRGADVIIDVSTAQAAAEIASRCAALGTPLVLGVTGLDDAQQAAVVKAAKTVAVLQSGNFSLGLNLLLSLVRQAARALGPAYDIEIFETHHRRKLDAPSGSALMLGQAAAAGRGVDLDEVAVGRDGGRTGARPAGAIGFCVSRGGGVIGEHAVSFASEAEVVTLSHSALDRGLFARGALAAARWLAARPPGLYSMADVLEGHGVSDGLATAVMVNPS